MDAVSGLLDGPRARGAFVLRSVLRPPWSLRIADGAPLSVIVVVSGEAHVQTDAGGSVHAATPGTVVVVSSPAPYVVSDSPGRAPSAVIGPDQVCAHPDGGPLTGFSELGVRTWGHDLEGPHVLLTGTYQLPAETSRRLLDALPPLLSQPLAGDDLALLRWLEREVGRDGPGQVAVLDRLLDLVLVSAVRSWLDRPDTPTPRWYAAHADPVLRPVLAVIDDRPGDPWTVASLAAVAGVSRAALARRFTETVGEPPMAYLTGRRLEVAADLLLEPGATLTAVARRVGYGTPFALSAAFTRVRGLSPQDHRRTRPSAWGQAVGSPV
ncbi:AraC family transcriptional regulator [Modestobacter sp. Leaf380]|uniref:AraC family transcriptional regulator n=1 Tax=Modestobacter sp. Leaf380 TaxID=1736356 RepID=UPI0006F495BB|nr:AraC family transcriptional regulator [Modestobacter sp. Leaf380]KQS71175.1 AraC family transcriptional regulator [Modestobacter sp. Leaf380]